LTGWVVHGVDAGELCRSVARKYFASNPGLNPSDREDLESYLLEHVWRLGERYAPTTRSARFDSYAGAILQRRCVDWRRSRYRRTRWQWSDGRSYERRHPAVVILDAGADGDRLADTLAADGGDPAVDHLADAVEGFDVNAARGRDRDHDAIRREADRRGEGRARPRAA
jgi:DNA-directed RNA polymerase specialized sigma24 family protein